MATPGELIPLNSASQWPQALEAEREVQKQGRIKIEQQISKGRTNTKLILLIGLVGAVAAIIFGTIKNIPPVKFGLAFSLVCLPWIHIYETTRRKVSKLIFEWGKLNNDRAIDDLRGVMSSHSKQTGISALMLHYLKPDSKIRASQLIELFKCYVSLCKNNEWLDGSAGSSLEQQEVSMLRSLNYNSDHRKILHILERPDVTEADAKTKELFSKLKWPEDLKRTYNISDHFYQEPR